MVIRKCSHGLLLLLLAASVLWAGSGRLLAQGNGQSQEKKITHAERKAAAARNAAAGLLPGVAGRTVKGAVSAPLAMGGAMAPDGVPHYFGPFANYANSPMPSGQIGTIVLDSSGSGYTSPVVTIADVYGTGSGATADVFLDSTGGIALIDLTNPGTGYTAPIVVIQDPTGSGAAATAVLGGAVTGGIRKFVDSLPGLNAAGANNLGQYIPVAIPDTTTFPGADYYEIELGQYTEQLHTDLPPTTLRGYRQTNTTDSTVSQFHYLGPLIVAKRNVPVRIKFTNKLPIGAGGDLFIPVDKTVMGAGMGPLDMPGMPGMKEEYTQNRATLHLHGGLVPWISDGTPHQWTTPAGENTQYPKGVSVSNVPDMPAPGPGSLTFYYNNQQSARLMFYHDHAYGITRLNVYVGEAAGYLLSDQVEEDLINGTNVSGVNPQNLPLLPGVGIPLIIQDKTFVDATTIAAQDPTWRWGTGAIDPMTGWPMPKTGDLWIPSVYMPAQNPSDPSGASAFGRWQYGPWFWPPTTDITHGPIPNEYYDSNCDPATGWCEPPLRPDVPSPSMGMEAFMDTAMVNGTAYPYLEVDPKTYRFRILNAADDRFVNLHMYVADGTVLSPDGRQNTEVKMVPALATPGFPPTWSNDARAGGVPDPATAGPSWIQIGTEGGFLPAPVVIPPQPINWNMNATAFNVGNVTDHSLLLGCAERADVLVDFSQFAGKTLILYNDAPAAFPALDPRYDYYTGHPDETATGGAPTTLPGYGPNTRTIMQIRVRSVAPDPAYNLALLNSVFAKTATNPGVFDTAQDKIIVPQAAYDSAYNASLPADAATQYVQLHETQKTFTPLGLTSPVTIKFQAKAIHDEMGAAYDTEFGRMGGLLGLELPGSNSRTQNILLYNYATPPVDVMRDTLDTSMTALGTATDGTQIWMISHNGVDTHPIHFHLFNVQLINRVAWDGALLAPEPNELGWKETVRVNPLEHTIVAMRPVAPTQPFDLPNSIRPIDPTMPLGATLGGPPGGFQDPAAVPVVVKNHLVNFGWEYVWHCHILSHEEMDMMHPLAFAVAPKAPSNLSLTLQGSTGTLRWTDNSANETNFVVQRASDPGFSTDLVTYTLNPNVTTLVDKNLKSNRTYYYRVAGRNQVGDTAVYAGSAGFPTQTIDSAFSNVVFTGRAVTGPLAPSGLTATQQAGPQIALAWVDNATDETVYQVWRGVGTGALALIASLPANSTSYVDTAVTPGNSYTYRVTAVNALGQAASSNQVTVTIGGLPLAPTSVTVVNGRVTGGKTSIAISWTYPTGGPAITGFTIQRATDAAFTAPTTNSVSATSTTSIQTGLPTGTSYYYRIRAESASGSSAWANASPFPLVLP